MSNLFPENDPNQPTQQPNHPGQGAHNPFSTPQGYPAQQPAYDDPNMGDSTGGVIPYKNPHALISYYLGLVALLPVLGVPFGIAAMILGIMGLRNRKKNPVIKGSVHAWIGICGGIFSLICGGLIGTVIITSVFAG